MSYNLLKCLAEDCMETNLARDLVCPSCGSKRVVGSKPKVTDFVLAWEMDLENANRHDLTNMPSELYDTLSDHIKDKALLLKIFAELYEKEIGI